MMGTSAKYIRLFTPEPSIGELLCIGTRYLRSDYSQDDIPYTRVAKRLWYRYSLCYCQP
ncbi:hypothetical protein [Rickettsiella massiliensis]|uniref:hypothetical protein n=1 Tax=Rickettsiella massiliensis TaxID=676517 RepID=UPI0012EA9912|nr:hypothetical protein [Rickettsiella massiliensis]